MSDPTETFHLGEEQPTLTVGVVIVEDGKILLVRHEEESDHIPGTYGIPSGRLKEGESLATAAARELNEETGLEASEDDLTEIGNRYEQTVTRADGTPHRFIGVGFRCRRFTGTLRPSCETTPEWHDLSQIDSLPLLPGLGDTLTVALSEHHISKSNSIVEPA